MKLGPDFAEVDLHSLKPGVKAAIDATQNSASRALREAVARWLRGPHSDVSFSQDRALMMLSLSEADLPAFERDAEFKSYPDSNHVFADLLVPIAGAWPILFFISPSNPPGVRLETQPGKLTAIFLGRPYAFAEICRAVAGALRQQNISSTQSAWFATVLAARGLNPDDPAFAPLTGLIR